MLRKYALLPFVPVIAVPLVLYAPMLVVGKAIFWGTPALQFVPWRAYGWELLSKGQLPLWNPLLGMGAPLAANYQSAFFYPPNWIEAVFWALGGVPWQAWAQTFVVMLHLIWAGIGTTLLVRRMGSGVLGQTIAGMAFGGSGYLVARAGFISINAAVAWLPWILSGIWLLIAHPRSKKVLIGLVISLAMQLLAGHAQTVWYTYLLAFLWAGFWSWQKAVYSPVPGQTEPASKSSSSYSIGQTARTMLRIDSIDFKRIVAAVTGAWARTGLAILLATGIAAVQLLPTAEYLMLSQRATSVDIELAMTYSFWPWRILGMFVPDLFGNPVHGDYSGYANFWEDALYIGLLPALLALSVLLRPGRWPNLPEPVNSNNWTEKPLQFRESRRSLVLFLWVVLIVGLGLALGKNTPLFPWLYRNVPTFSMFQAPARFLIWFEICLVLLVAIGADRWRRPEKRALYWTRLGTAAGFAVSLGAALTWCLMNESKDLPGITLSAITGTALAGFWGLLAGMLSLTAPIAQTPGQDLFKTRGQRFWLWGVIFMVGFDLLVAGWGLNPGVDLEFYGQTSASLPEIVHRQNFVRLYLTEKDEYELKFSRFLRFDTFEIEEDWQAMREVMLPNLNMLDKVASANNFDPLLTGRYSRWMETLPDASPELQAKWLNLMAVSVVETVDIRSPSGVRFDPAAYVTSETASELTSHRVRFVPCARFVPDGEAAWQAMISSKPYDSGEVVIEGLTAGPGGNCERSSPGSVQQVEETPTAIEFQVDASRPGWLVLADQWYPGWYGTLDGQPIKIERADFLFRAIQIDPGQHLVEFRYRPISFIAGFSITFCVLAGMIVFGLRQRSDKK